jgi:hypothetical protein
VKADNIFENPMLHFVKFGLGNPVVAWCVERGLYDEWCPGCRGRGYVVASPCANREALGGFECDRERGCDECRSTCRECRGTRLRPSRSLCAQDFGGDEDVGVALKLGVRLPEDFDKRQLR